MKLAFLVSVFAVISMSSPSYAADPATSSNPWAESEGVYRMKEAGKACENSGFSADDIGAGNLKGKPGSYLTCVKGLALTGSRCTEYKKATESYAAFQKTCREAGSQNLVKCIETAAACALEDEGEEGDIVPTNDRLSSIGIEPVENSDELKNICIKFNRKDYSDKKSEISKDLREAQKDLQNIQKERAKSAQDYQSDKRKLVERQSRVQESMSKLVDSNQKEAQERAQQMSRDLIDSEKEQSAVRVQNIQAQGQIAKIQGQRAAALAQLTDSMISANCTEQIDLLLKKWAAEGPKSLNGSAALFRSNAEKKRRIQDQHRACIETATAARKATRKQYSAEINAIKDQIKSNDQQAARIAEQNSQLGTQYQAFLARQKMSETEAYNRAQAELQAIQSEGNELDRISAQRSNEATADIGEATKRVNDLTRAMSNVGARPSGDKRPNDAMPHADDFFTQIDILQSSPTCKPLADELLKIGTSEVKAAYNKMNGVSTSTGSSATTTSGSPGTATRSTPGSR